MRGVGGGGCGPDFYMKVAEVTIAGRSKRWRPVKEGGDFGDETSETTFLE